MAVIKYKNPKYTEGGSEPKYIVIPTLTMENDEVYVGTTEPTEGEKIWVNPSNGLTKYKNGESWENLVPEVDLSNYLVKDNSAEYIPSGEYNPATKKYVDESKKHYNLMYYGEVSRSTSESDIDPQTFLGYHLVITDSNGNELDGEAIRSIIDSVHSYYDNNNNNITFSVSDDRGSIGGIYKSTCIQGYKIIFNGLEEKIVVDLTDYSNSGEFSSWNSVIVPYYDSFTAYQEELGISGLELYYEKRDGFLNIYISDTSTGGIIYSNNFLGFSASYYTNVKVSDIFTHNGDSIKLLISNDVNSGWSFRFNLKYIERYLTQEDYNNIPETKLTDGCTYYISGGPIIRNGVEYGKTFNTGINTVTTLASLPITKRSIVATITAATSLSLDSDLELGQELYIRIYNNSSSAITQPIPNSGNFVSMNGTSVSIPSKSFIEMSIWCYESGKYSIRIGEIA